MHGTINMPNRSLSSMDDVTLLSLVKIEHYKFQIRLSFLTEVQICCLVTDSDLPSSQSRTHPTLCIFTLYPF